MGGKSKAPKAPNYYQMSLSQAAIDKKAADEQTQANRPNQNNASGSMQWTNDGNGNWTQNETMSPQNQALYDQAMGLQSDAMTKLSQQGDFKGPDQIQWNPDAMQQYGDAIYKSTMDRAAPKQAQDMEAFTTKLRQQGLVPGSEGYDRAMKNLMTSQGDVNSQAANQATIQSKDQYRNDYLAQLQGQNQNYGQAKSEYEMPWDRVGNAQNLAQAQKPSFASFNQGTGYNPQDLMGAANAKYQARMGSYNADQQKKGNTLNTAGKIGGAAMMS
jgi:hypothetical protein